MRKEIKMKIYCMSDIHGFLSEFDEALYIVEEHLREPDSMLILLGDHIHGGSDSAGVLDRIIGLQKKYGKDKVVALMGNHEEMFLRGECTLERLPSMYSYDDADDSGEDYSEWIEDLPRIYRAGNTIFVHAGINEDCGEDWEWDYDMFTEKYPAQLGEIKGVKEKVVAGHIGTAEISGDPNFHGIYFDGASHYYIDGTVMESLEIPILMVDTTADKYYRVTEGGIWEVQPYDAEN